MSQAKMLSLPAPLLARRDIVNSALKYNKVPWRHQGRSKNHLDCAGLFVRTFHDLGYGTSIDYIEYNRIPNEREVINQLNKYFIRVCRAPKPGDVLVLHQIIYACHIAIYFEKDGKKRILHANARRRKVLDETFEPEWKPLVRAIFEYPNLEDK